MRSPRSVLTAVLVLSLPTLLAGKCRKDPDPIEPTDPVTVVEPPSVVVPLQVVSVSPSTLAAGQSASAKVYGAGFEPGATVRVGDLAAPQVTRDDANTLSIGVPALTAGAHDLIVTNPDGRSSTLRQAFRVADQEVDDSCRRMAMYFELDAATLSQAARDVLDGAMPCLSRQPRIRLEGHADERGTTDYNVALGQRRAESVQAYLMTKGLPERSLPVISYGEERPADSASTEAAWAKNRRVELVSQ
jgi:peptidoglycan-associated lipoprotein